MKAFKGEITLNRNSRGCYILDTVKGCNIVNTRPRGCYDDCYAKNIADRYKFDFGSPVKRDFPRSDYQPSLFGFKDSEHASRMVKAIRKIKMPFVRIGEMGDPSEDWWHTLAVCEEIRPAGKPIVIITKHWHPIPEELLPTLAGICINTSVSALDAEKDLAYRLGQYNRLKPHCKSVLRIVSCNFNMENEEGERRQRVQEKLFENAGSIDTVFRPSPSNPFLVAGVIKAEKKKFLGANMLASVYNPDTYFGRCETCPDMCGVTT